MTDQQDIAHEVDQLPMETAHRVNESETTIRNAMERHNNSALTNLLHWREGRTMRLAAIEEIRQGLDYRKQALQLALDTRLQSMEEACNHVLLTSKTQLRQQRNLFFAQKLSELNNEMDRITSEFIDTLDEQIARLDRIRHERMRKREQQRLERTFDHFMGTLERLEKSFIHIIEEGVGRQ